MKKIKLIEQFLAKAEDGFIVQSSIGNEIVFPFAKNGSITIDIEGEFIDLFDKIDCISLSLSYASFEFWGISNAILNDLWHVFNLFKEIHNSTHYSLKFKSNEYSMFLVNFKRYRGKYFCILYATRKEREPQSAAEDSYSDNIVYIHGIWEMELTKEYTAQIFR